MNTPFQNIELQKYPSNKTCTMRYRFGFGGHENDNEVKGTGNHLAFGDYGYDPRLGRRWNIDPLTFKYPYQSPYLTFNNNPIYYLDPDGREGIGSVDHKNKTITIKAVYFVEVGKEGFSSENYNELQTVNATLNSQGYTVTDKNSSLHGYAVVFELKFVPVPSDKKAQNYAESEKALTESNSTGGTDLITGGLDIGNSMILTDDITFESIPSVQETAKENKVGPEKVLGITNASSQHINIPEKSKVLTALHEIFHTLYFNKDGAKSGIGGGKEIPNAEDINNLVEGLQENERIIEE